MPEPDAWPAAPGSHGRGVPGIGITGERVPEPGRGVYADVGLSF